MPLLEQHILDSGVIGKIIFCCSAHSNEGSHGARAEKNESYNHFENKTSGTLVFMVLYDGNH